MQTNEKSEPNKEPTEAERLALLVQKASGKPFDVVAPRALAIAEQFLAAEATPEEIQGIDSELAEDTLLCQARIECNNFMRRVLLRKMAAALRSEMN